MCLTDVLLPHLLLLRSLPCRDIGFLSKLNCYWFFCRYFVFAIVTIVALLASPIVLWLDPWIWGFPTIYFLVSANVAVVVYLYFTIFSYIFLLFSVVSAAGWLACSRVELGCWDLLVCYMRYELSQRCLQLHHHHLLDASEPCAMRFVSSPAGAGLLQDVGHDQRHPGPQEVQELEGDAQVRRQRQQQLAAQLPQALHP
jgi:hypothetical protein